MPPAVTLRGFAVAGDSPGSAAMTRRSLVTRKPGSAIQQVSTLKRHGENEAAECARDFAR